MRQLRLQVRQRLLWSIRKFGPSCVAGGDPTLSTPHSFAWTDAAPCGSKFRKDLDGNQMNLAKVGKARSTSGQVSMANVWAACASPSTPNP